jgi:hypothetical protein
MFMNLGDVPAGSTLYCPFATYAAAGNSVTITGLAVTDVEIYKDGSVTQRASDNGYTLLDTDGIDFDGITGIHGFSVDLSDNTTAGFYAAGSVYWIVVSAITVDSQTVNFGYYFTIEKSTVFRPTLPAGAIPALGIIDNGTAQSATGTTLVLRSAAAFANDEIIGATILITGGSAGVGQARLITDYVSTTDTATVETWTTTPTGTITYVIFGTSASSGGSGLDAAGVRTAIGLASANLDTQLSGIQSDTDNIQTRIPAALVSGRIDASVGAMAANTMTAAAAASDLTTELQSGLATAANLTTVDTVVDAIKVQTDKLTFTVANVLDANVQRINDVAVTGDGSSGDKFGV